MKRHGNHSSGFTLIEVVAALAIMIALFGGVYGIVSGSLTLSRTANEARTAELRLHNLDAMLRGALEGLPPSTQFDLEPLGDGAQLTLTGEPGNGLLNWNRQAALSDRVFLRIENDPSGKGHQRIILAHARVSALGQVEPAGELRLFDGLRSAAWRLYPSISGEWVASWTRQQGRPVFAELTLEMMNDPGEHRLIFWIPSYQQPLAQ